MSDDKLAQRKAQKIFFKTEKKALHIFTATEGADAHCQLNNFSLMHELVFDWLDDIFQVKRNQEVNSHEAGL